MSLGMLIPIAIGAFIIAIVVYLIFAGTVSLPGIQFGSVPLNCPYCGRETPSHLECCRHCGRSFRDEPPAQ